MPLGLAWCVRTEPLSMLRLPLILLCAVDCATRVVALGSVRSQLNTAVEKYSMLVPEKPTELTVSRLPAAKLGEALRTVKVSMLTAEPAIGVAAPDTTPRESMRRS